MRKMMFNDRYGLTQAVLNGTKTQTRRILNWSPLLPEDDVESVTIIGNEVHIIANNGESLIHCKQPYKVGETVAVAQSYASIIDELENPRNASCAGHYEMRLGEVGHYIGYIESPAFTNKMLVQSELMPHQIRITNIRLQKLRDISEEDCIKEGIVFYPEISKYYFERHDKQEGFYFNTPRQAFADLIDKIYGKGAWDFNPYVFAYDFELIN